jgi:hypothetical protein
MLHDAEAFLKILIHTEVMKKIPALMEIEALSSSHGVEYEVQRDYTAPYPRRVSSSSSPGSLEPIQREVNSAHILTFLFL